VTTTKSAVLTFTDEEPPPRVSRGRAGIDWAGIDRELRKAKGKWATLGPWRSGGAASRHARRIADDRSALDAAHYELEVRAHHFDDGVVGSVLWLRYVGI
jgi:hypothetical protein